MPNLTLHHGTMHHTQGEGFVISAVQSPLCQPESLPSTIVRGLYIYNRRHPPACRALASHLQQSRFITTGPRIKFPRRTRIDGFARSATLGTHQPQKTCPTARRCLPAVPSPPASLHAAPITTSSRIWNPGTIPAHRRRNPTSGPRFPMPQVYRRCRRPHPPVRNQLAHLAVFRATHRSNIITAYAAVGVLKVLLAWTHFGLVCPRAKC